MLPSPPQTSPGVMLVLDGLGVRRRQRESLIAAEPGTFGQTPLEDQYLLTQREDLPVAMITQHTKTESG